VPGFGPGSKLTSRPLQRTQDRGLEGIFRDRVGISGRGDEGKDLGTLKFQPQMNALCVGSMRWGPYRSPPVFPFPAPPNSGKLVSPKWKNFKGLKLLCRDKIRLNNAIWRAWYLQCEWVLPQPEDPVWGSGAGGVKVRARASRILLTL
jgi:hypothetical protein